ncbi:28S rRNA (cytosine-C(5))-methyltransferase [Adelges cooleyi]|uniref:28S rRNA (cytosine-C(5))-methyltransferase n=1 Tax=Adelges cooleyi TaxID=133065 RepID=UPI00217FEB4B|nr:28S rRNA (cytosine-C(5))-methyltransferase [Adelges cooleyi]XP_050444059.1 28S rRNA (cytosine-C(5))-methyltransferase [Adelges cooleyi]
MVISQAAKKADRIIDKTTGLYKIAAKIIKQVKTGNSYKTLLYRAQYPNKLTLNAVLMNVFKWEKVLDVLIEKSNILKKENDLDKNLAYVLITEMMWSKFGLKGSAKNILAIKKYKHEFVKLMKELNLETLVTSMPNKAWKPRYFRVNTLLTTVDDVLKKLAEHKYKKLKSPATYSDFLELLKSKKFSKNCFVQDLHIKELLVFNPKVKFYKLEEYNNGSLIIQDKASCLAPYILKPEPESTVLDMCAAPGMKTSYLAAIMQNKGTLYAVDRCKDRFVVMQKMLEKYGVTNVETFNMDALTFPYVDNVKYILVDPSCSGSGIVDRVRNDPGQNENNEIRLKKLANVHAQLLNHALKSYPNLERLVYSTCSSNPEENEAVVDEALSVTEDFKLLDCTKLVKGWKNKGAPGYNCSDLCLNAVPSTDYTNGFFIAVFVRKDFIEPEQKEDEEAVKVEEVVAKVKCNDTKAKVPLKVNKSDQPIKKSKNARRKERRLKQQLIENSKSVDDDKNIKLDEPNETKTKTEAIKRVKKKRKKSEENEEGEESKKEDSQSEGKGVQVMEVKRKKKKAKTEHVVDKDAIVVNEEPLKKKKKKKILDE